MTEWVKISDMEKTRATAMRLDGVSPLSAEDIPDTHTITVSERSISVDNSEIIQNNIKTDLIELVLDGEWYDCGSVYVTLGRSAGYEEPVQLEWEGTALTFPAQLGTEVGGIDVSVVGYGSDGEMRLVTKESSNTFRVVASGYVEGVPPTEENLDILAQIIQQGDAAEDAARAANAAATSATSAASSANSAASSANSAASSANSAATKANSAAVDAQNAYDTLQPYMATIDSCANILHREVGPDSVVTADDSFPCKPVEMTVYGNTVQNLWVNPNGTRNGVTVTPNSDGSITVNGTASNTAIVQVTSYALKPSGKYTLSIDKSVSSVSGCGASVEWYKDDTAVNNILIGNGSTLSGTFTIPSDTEYCKLRFRVPSGTTVSGTYRVMLNEGSTAQPWCPPGLNSVGQLRYDEKNLWVNPTNRTTSGVTLKNNDDGSFTVSGTNTAGGAIYMGSTGPFALEAGKTYTMSIDGDPNFSAYVNLRDSGGSFISSVSVGSSIGQSSTTFSSPESTSTFQLGISVQAGVTVSGTYKVMLNEGSAAKPWVSPESKGCVQVVTAGKNLFTSNSNAQIQGNGGLNQILTVGTKASDIPIKHTVVFSLEYRLSSGAGTITIQQNGSPYVSFGINYLALIGDGQWHRVSGIVRVGDDFNKKDDIAIRLDNVTGLVEFRNLQLELGSTATDYEPPNITTTTIDLQGHTLNALPDGTRDELRIDGGGNVVLEKRVDAAEVDTEVNWTQYISTNTYYSSILPYPHAKTGDTVDISDNGIMCDKFLCLDSNWDTTNNAPSVALSDNSAYHKSVFFAPPNGTEPGDFSFTVLYPLATPQIIDLGTIAPPTMAAPNVTAYVADDTPAEMILDYVRDVNIVHSRLEERVAALELASATS